jgi:hypothetical protein
MLLCSLDHCLLLAVHHAGTHQDSGHVEADWIRRVGVIIAVAGALIAAPDGTASIWARVVELRRQIRRLLARYLPFLRRAIPGEVTSSGDSGVGTEAMTVRKRVEWDNSALPDDKIERLHQQVEFLIQEVDDLRKASDAHHAALRTEIAQAEARSGERYRELVRRFEAQERRTARVDARGIWVISSGIVLTGIPDELAAQPFVGSVVAAAAIGLTIWMGLAVRADFRASM